MTDPVYLNAQVRRRKTTPNAALINLTGSGIILAAAGLWILSYHLMGGAGSETPTETAFALYFGLLIAGVGAGMAVQGFRTRSRLLEVERLRKEHPGEPWRSRPEWAGARLESANRKRMLVSWAVTAPVALLVLPIGIQAVGEIRTGNTLAWAAFVLPLFAFGMLVHAIRTTARYRRYGTTELLLASFPPAPGTILSGTVRTAVPADFPDGLEARLRCVEARWGGSKKRQRQERVVFQEERTVPWADVRREGDAMTFSVAFQLPGDAPETGEPGDEPWHEWTLTMGAVVAGADFDASFDVPVIATGGPGGAREDAGEEVVDTEGQPTPGAPALERPDPSRVRVEETSDGVDLTYPVGSKRSEAAILLKSGIFGLVMGAAAYLAEAPIWFTGLFIGLTGLMATIGICLWLMTREVRVTSDTVELRAGLVRPWGTTRIPAERIEEIHLGEGARSGSAVYWKVVARTNSGAKITLGTGMKEWGEAAWIADRVARTIGVPFDRSVS